MALKMTTGVWLGYSQRFVPGQEKELFKILRTKKDRQHLVDKGVLVETEDEAKVPDEDEEEKSEEGTGAPWKGKK